MNFYFYNHQNKGLPLIRALEAHGWFWTSHIGTARVLFTDADVPTRVPRLQKFHQSGGKVFTYPHAARPNIFNDFEGYPPFQHIRANFVTAPGHVEIMRRIGVLTPIEAVGWFLSPVKPFQPRKSYRKVLFAPIHPNNNGTLSEIDKKINADTYRVLLKLLDAGMIDLTVRFLRGLERNGLWPDERVTYIEGQPDLSYQEIDKADIVVSHQTFAFIAIARGVPTVMMAEDVPPRIGSEEIGNFQYVKNFDRYRDLLMYPLDILAVDDPIALFKRAISSDCDIADWRARMIGEPFDPNRFVAQVERYL